MIRSREGPLDELSFLGFLEDIGVLSSSQALKLKPISGGFETESDLLSSHLMGLNEDEMAELSSRVFEKYKQVKSLSKKALATKKRNPSPDISRINTISASASGWGATTAGGASAEAFTENDALREIKKKRFQASLSCRKKQREDCLSLFDRLYEERLGFEEASLLKQQAQREFESKRCPFTPESPYCSGADNQKWEENTDLFNTRMENYVSKKRLALIANAFKQSEKVVENCTFKPDINRSCSNIHSKDLNGQGLQFPVHERLYHNALALNNRTLQKKLQKSQKERAECTFSPTINGSQHPDANTAQIATKRLFEHSFLKSADNERREQIRQEKEVKDCTFAPKLSASTVGEGVPTASASSKANSRAVSKLLERGAERDVVQRLFEWRKEKDEKLIKKKLAQTSSVQAKATSYSSTQTPIFDRLYKEMFEKNKRLESLKKETLKDILTFAPKISRPLKTKSRSSSVTEIRPKNQVAGDSRLNKSGDESKLLSKSKLYKANNKSNHELLSAGKPRNSLRRNK